MAESRGSPGSNIYTVLALIALVVLVIGIVYLCVRSGEIFATGNPFSVEVSSAAERLPTELGA